MNDSDLPPDEPFDAAEFLAGLISRSQLRKDPPLHDDAFPTVEDLVAAVAKFYLDSGDFNGRPVPESEEPHEVLKKAIALGLIQLVTEAEFPNPHIRPWSDARIDRQLEQLQRVLDPGTPLGGCVYPTPSAMATQDLSAYRDRPYTQRQAAGHGDLECVYFKMAALEDYRNDPRYGFEFGDFAVNWGIGDEAYMDENEPDSDKIGWVRAGFGYDAEADAHGPGPIHRYVAVLLTDLNDLTASHQLRLSTWEQPADGLHPHPLWWGTVMGEWVDYIGPFDKVIGELDALNQIWAMIYGLPLFKTTERHRDWGWVLRPSTSEWDKFVLLTDQLISDNIDTKALNAANAPKKNAAGDTLGTLTRLEAFLEGHAKGGVKDTVRVFKTLRASRNKPAHAARPTLNDQTLVVQQRDLLFDLADSLRAIRVFMSTHPSVKNSDWKPWEYLERWLLL